MNIKRAGTQTSMEGFADWFTGMVRVTPLFQATEPARVASASVTFEPRADSVAYASARPDTAGDRRLRLGAARG